MCSYIYIHTHTHTYVFVCASVCVCVCVCVCARARALLAYMSVRDIHDSLIRKQRKELQILAWLCFV
jgi:hypothetical protein